jgi:hypothetical protein
MQRIMLSLLSILFLSTLAFGQSNQAGRVKQSAPVGNQVVRGFFDPKNNCTACNIKVVKFNGKPAIEVVLGCSKQPRNVKINGTVVPANNSSGSSYIAVLENAPRGSYHVSVRSQWVWGGAYYSECGADVCVPYDVTGAASLAGNNAFYCPSTPITANTNFRYATRHSYTFKKVLSASQTQQVGNQVIKNGNSPATVNLMTIFHVQNNRYLDPGDYQVTIAASNVVSSKESVVNFTIRESTRANPCFDRVSHRMKAKPLRPF